MRRRRSTDNDNGTILVLTLILTVILAIVVIALATYATTGLATSQVTTNRTESNSVTSAGMSWYLEELQAKRAMARPEDSSFCDNGTPPTPPPIIAPPSVLPNIGASVAISCELIDEIGNHPTVRLTAVGLTAEGTQRSIEVIAQVPRSQYTIQIYSWDAD